MVALLRFIVALTTLLIFCSSFSLVVPMSGWAPTKGDSQQWSDDTGACLLKEEHYGQAFPLFQSSIDANKFANKLKVTLGRSMKNVVTQPIDQGKSWAILVAYDFKDSGNVYRIQQLYLSEKGLLRTITGSSTSNTKSSCVSAMLYFIRYFNN